MKKQQKLDLKLNIDKEEYLSQNFDILYDRLTYNPLLKILYLLIIFIVSLCFNKRICLFISFFDNFIYIYMVIESINSMLF